MKKCLLTAFILAMSVQITLSAATWKVFFYMDSSDELSDMAIKNISDMMRGKPQDSVEFLIQLHAYRKAGLRYRVTDQGLIFLEEIELHQDALRDFIDAAEWGFSGLSADHTMLIMSNHGWGILDPRWNEQTDKWESGASSLSNVCMINKNDGISSCNTHKERRKVAFTKENEDTLSEHKEHHKGFMFTVEPRGYLTNQDLIDGLSWLQRGALGGKFLDVLAFDTCMGDMFEVAYQVAPYAHFLVGNQSCALKDGFDYQGIVSLLNQESDPRTVVKGMVEIFDTYYKEHDASGIYTHAALDLSRVHQTSRALDGLVNQLLEMPERHSAIMDASHDAPRFCMWPMYTDLIAFCKTIEEQIATAPVLQKAFKNLYDEARELVVARCGGNTTKDRAYGFAIYLPHDRIDSSYYETVFARESQWINLLNIVCDKKR